MKLLLPREVAAQLTTALAEAGAREIGGILMGEHVGVDTFLVKEVTIQRLGGTYAAFVRLVEAIIAPLRAFFDSTGHNYTRFNYIGEWHSHHSFALVPSSRDNATMLAIINDGELGARFVVLMLIALDDLANLQLGVTLYRYGHRPTPAVGIIEGA